MWLITNFGFFSVVEKPDDKEEGTLTVRSRVRSDLEMLRDRYLPGMQDIQADKGSDYKYRARVPRGAVAIAALDMVRDINYSNFKNSVSKAQGHKRESLYHKVWNALYDLQAGDFELTDDAGAKASKGTPVSPGSA